LLARRVLLADDTPEIRQLLRIALELEGNFEVVGEAADGRQALDLADSHRPDAVILDLAMPVMDGLQAIPAIRRATPHTKILVLSGFTSEQMGREALAVGADAYLEKGVPPGDIVAALNRLCEGVSNGDGGDAEPPAERISVPADALEAVTKEPADDPIGALAHELLTPVAVVRGFAEAIATKAHGLNEKEIAEWAERIVANAEALVQIVRSFRGSSEVYVGAVELDLSRFDPAPLVRATVKDLSSLTDDREVRTSLIDGTLVYADAVKVRQILTNLVSNAVKFAPGPIDIEMEVGKFYVEIAVCDQGPGVPEEARGELFKRFARLGAAPPGSGLGLYVSRQLARAQGGDVVYSPREGGGARFKVRIPVTD